MTMFRAAWQSDTTTNSSKKVFIVPANTEWNICTIGCIYSTNATTGTRQVAVYAVDADGATILDANYAGLTQTANQASYRYSFSGGQSSETTRYSNHLVCPLSIWTLTAAQQLWVLDAAAIAPGGTGENLLVSVNVLTRTF